MKRLEGDCQLTPQGRRHVIVFHKEVDSPHGDFRQQTAESDPPEGGVEVSPANPLYFCLLQDKKAFFCRLSVRVDPCSLDPADPLPTTHCNRDHISLVDINGRIS